MNKSTSVGIAHAAYVLPQHGVTLEQWCDEQYRSGDAAVLRSNGVDTVYRVRGDAKQIDLGLAAVRKLLHECPRLRADEVDALVVCHTSPCNALPMPYTLTGELRQRLGFTRALTFSIAQQQCVSPIHALRVLRALFAKQTGWQNALIVCVDTILREDLRAIGTAGMHSDGASVMWVCRDAPTQLLGLQTYNDPVAVHGILPDGRYESNNNYLWSLVSVIRRVIKDAGLTPSDLHTVLPHNVNLPAWYQAMDALRLPKERLFTRNFSRIGHVFGSDAAVNLADSAALKTPGHHLVFASGIGGCFGGFILSTQASAWT
ncbi:MAG: 3-oxoacyl-[acyl-carrier-protein] synthase III C-terminal domain-containing protein [Pseudomonadota bacterium]|nr:3-oxoacyl-[acyl-carrier-protein] synthase III C-terminal domain-containing protein [Pseudomonadota bacterium]